MANITKASGAGQCCGKRVRADPGLRAKKAASPPSSGYKLKSEFEGNLHLPRLIGCGRYDAKIRPINNSARRSKHDAVEHVKCFKPERERRSITNRELAKER